jgi:hypothetical protein
MFVISFVSALLTFKGGAGLSPESTVGLFDFHAERDFDLHPFLPKAAASGL